MKRMSNSSKLPLSNPFATEEAPNASVTQSALNSHGKGSGTILPPGLRTSREKQKDPWKEHNFQRRVRNLHSLESFGGSSLNKDDDEDDSEEDEWASAYLTKPPPHSRVNSDKLDRAPATPYCRNCDKHFYSVEALQTHVEEHETCGVEGCPYTAHPKLVLNHYQSQHLTGLADKVWRVQTPEDIAKWREDRKRNFPTAARVAARKRELKERKKRGNVLNNQYFGKINGENNRGRMLNQNHRGGRGGNTRGRGGRGGRGAAVFRSVDNEFCSDSEESDDNDVAIGGTMTLTFDEGKDEIKTKVDEVQSSGLDGGGGGGGGILGGLACDYASSDEEAEVGEAKTESKPDFDMDKNGERVSKTGVTNTDDNPAIRKKKNRKRKRNGVGGRAEVVERLLTDGQVKYQLTKKRQRRDPTLLERLLAPEIRRERNIILQCVRYIVRKDFFDERV